MKKLLLTIFAALLFIPVLKAQCLFTFTFNTSDASCPNNNDGSAEVMVVGGVSPYTYMWSASAGSQATAMADSLMPGSYSVIITDMLGCMDTGFVTVTSPATPQASICMVTCDGSSTNNIVYWDKTVYTNVDSFIIYREVMAGAYARIASVSNDSMSQFIDTSRSIGPANGDPNLASYRYKIQILDTCGNYGPMSLYHNTLYITNQGAGEFEWSIPYTIEGMPNPVSNYILLCDTANVDVWGPVSTVSATDTTAMDPGFATHGTIANWRVKTAWSITCDPTRASVNTTRSNIKRGLEVSTGLTSETLNASVIVFPNPAAGFVTVGLSPEIKSAVIRIQNTMGQVIIQKIVTASGTSGTNEQFDVSGISKGIYIVSIENGKNKIFKKLIVQ
jgi:hypothetical protein